MVIQLVDLEAFLEEFMRQETTSSKPVQQN